MKMILTVPFTSNTTLFVCENTHQKCINICHRTLASGESSFISGCRAANPVVKSLQNVLGKQKNVETRVITLRVLSRGRGFAGLAAALGFSQSCLTVWHILKRPRGTSHGSCGSGRCAGCMTFTGHQGALSSPGSFRESW